jgi:hypothetical protein
MCERAEGVYDTIAVVERSADRKLSNDKNYAATYAPHLTCPKSCPHLKGMTCYAYWGKLGFTSNRIMKKAKALFDGVARKRALIALAKEESRRIKALADTLKSKRVKRRIRIHVVGDCAIPESARIVGDAMRYYEAKVGAAAHTYTHTAKETNGPKLKDWQGARVLASCEEVSIAKRMLAEGWAVAMVTPPHKTNKVYTYGGLNVLPCPAQFVRTETGAVVSSSKAKGTRVQTCEGCNICQRPDTLRARNLVVGFEPDGITAKRLLPMLRES